MTSPKRKNNDAGWLWAFMAMFCMLIVFGAIPIDHIKQQPDTPTRLKRLALWLIVLTVIGFFGFGVYSACVAVF